MVFIETSVFTTIIKKLLSDENYSELQQDLAFNPEQGDMIPGSGGLRKIRWGKNAKGKRGGIRVIYYYRIRHEQIIFLYAYPKSKTENLTEKQLKVLKTIAEEWK